MRRTQNLKPWPKGVSGNPGGRPRETPLTDACRELLSKPAPDDASGRSYAEAIAEQLGKQALAGDVHAAREIADRAEGKARQAMEVSGPEGESLDLWEMTDEQLEARVAELVAEWNKDHK